MARKEYSDATKAAVLAALIAGTPTAEIAKTYKVPAGTVKSWKHRQDETPVAIVATEKREEIGGLCVDFLRECLRTLQVQVKHFGDTAWLKDQPAAEVARLFDTVAGRAFGLLEALEAGAEATAAPGPGPASPAGSAEG